MAQNSFASKFLNSILKNIFAVKSNPDKTLGELNNILLIRQHNQLGDMLAGVSLLRAIKEKYPKSHITLITSVDNYHGIVKNKFVDKLFVFDKSKITGPNGLLNLYKLLRKSYDAAIVPVTVSISFTSNLMARISNSKTRIGPNSLDGKPNESAYLFDRRIDINWRKYPDSNVSEHILEIVRPFGIDTKDFSSEITFDNNDILVAKEYLASINPKIKNVVIGLHVGAGKAPNRWSLKKYSELIDKLNLNYDCVFYLTGSDADREEISYVEKNSSANLNKYLNKGIPEVAALVSLSSLFITNDTGIMHVAGTTSTPQISLFGPTNPFNWAPCGKDKIFLRKSDLIDDISVNDVFDVCKILIEKNDRNLS